MANGNRIRLLRRLPGRSHEVYLAREEATERLVVVKTGGNTDALRREAAALSWLTVAGAAVSRSSELLIDHRDRPALVLEYVDGHHLRSPADFAAAGRALATFHAVSLSSQVPPSRALTQIPIQTVVSSGETLARAVGLDLAPLTLRLMAITACDLCCVHGDASPSNMLITPSGNGVLFDLENAHVGHPGLDVGRFLFLASVPPTTSDMLAEFLAGYGRPPIPAGDLNDWIAVAGLQIAIWRARNGHWGLSAMDAIARVAGWMGTGPVPLRASARRLTWCSLDQLTLPGSVTNATAESLNRLAKLEACLAYGFRNPASQRRRIRIACTRGTRRPPRTGTSRRTHPVTERKPVPG